MDLFKILLIPHILFGFTSLMLGTYILFNKKGDKRHRILGNMFFYSMLLNSMVAIPMCYFHPNYFLFLISIFTIYMLLTGKRYLKKKKRSDTNNYDWALTILMLLFAVGFVSFGIFHFIKQDSFGLVFIAFGVIGLLFSYQDYINFKGLSKIKNYFLTTHIQRMMGSYIASTTAFLVVNNTFLPNILAWLLPTMLIVPLIVSWTRKYKVERKNGT